MWPGKGLLLNGYSGLTGKQGNLKNYQEEKGKPLLRNRVKNRLSLKLQKFVVKNAAYREAFYTPGCRENGGVKHRGLTKAGGSY